MTMKKTFTFNLQLLAVACARISYGGYVNQKHDYKQLKLNDNSFVGLESQDQKGIGFTLKIPMWILLCANT